MQGAHSATVSRTTQGSFSGSLFIVLLQLLGFEAWKVPFHLETTCSLFHQESLGAWRSLKFGGLG